jgi:hypothetical protein
MPTIEALRAKVQAAIDRRGEGIVRVAQTMLRHSEPSFCQEVEERL